MVFSTKESYASASLAKEHCALMALQHVTPVAPHERKLPEPYRAVWLAMTTKPGGEDGPGSNKPLTAKEKAAAKAEEEKEGEEEEEEESEEKEEAAEADEHSPARRLQEKYH